jgi:GTPase
MDSPFQAVGGIGTKGPGETQIETDRRIIRNRISHLKEKLGKIENQRESQSKGRQDFSGYLLVGYTNAGKSTLFNLLTEC